MTQQNPSLVGRLARGANPIRRPKLIAGVVAVAAALGVYLGMQWPFDFGAGGGGGLGLGGKSGSGDAANSKAGDPDAAPAKEGPATYSTGYSGTADVLEVVIDGSGYALRERNEGKDVYAPITLAEAVRRAEESRGNRDGVRVRIYRRGSALPTAEEDLQRTLEQAVGEKAVQMMPGQLD
jgi:hypothetical protein